MTFQLGAKFVVNVVGQLQSGKNWFNHLTVGGTLKNTNNLQVGQTNGTTVTVGTNKLSITS